MTPAALRYHANREVNLARAAEYRRANRDKVRERARLYREKNAEMLKAKRDAYYVENKDRVLARQRKLHATKEAKERRIERERGLTPEAQRLLREVQSNRCPVCLHPFDERREARLDHDHDTGEVRGLLCHGCNTLEGRLKKYGARLQAYLENPPARALDLA